MTDTRFVTVEREANTCATRRHAQPNHTICAAGVGVQSFRGNSYYQYTGPREHPPDDFGCTLYEMRHVDMPDPVAAPRGD